MTEMTSDPFYTRQLDAIAPGDLSLAFPTRNGVIQIEADFENDDVTTHLLVNRGDDKVGNIVVKLATGRSLQAEEVAPVVVDGVPMDRRTRLFEEPLAELKLSKAEPHSPVNKDMWVAHGENLAVGDITLLQTFVNMIGDYARVEQERMRKLTVDHLDKPNKYL